MANLDNADRRGSDPQEGALVELTVPSTTLYARMGRILGKVTPGCLKRSAANAHSVDNQEGAKAELAAAMGPEAVAIFTALKGSIPEINRLYETSVAITFDRISKTFHFFDPSKRIDSLAFQVGASVPTNRGWRLDVTSIGEGRHVGKFVPISSTETWTDVGMKHSHYKIDRLPPEHAKNFLAAFNPDTVNTTQHSEPKVLIEQMRPRDPTIPFNAEQIEHAPNLMIHYGWADAVNANADLGLQYTLEKVLRGSVITSRDDGVERPKFIILSHGHAIAGLEALAAMTCVNHGTEQYLFETSIYMPIGGWKNEPRQDVAALGAQMWGDEITRHRESQTIKGLTHAGGVAIGLNGHRGDRDIKTGQRANIDPRKMLGPPAAFKDELARRNLAELVVITEHLTSTPEIPTLLPLSVLKESSSYTFDAANCDMYDYCVALQQLGVKVTVVSGEQRIQLPLGRRTSEFERRLRMH